MASNFINGKSVQVFLGEIIKSMPYMAASKKHFAGQIEGKKNGKNGQNYSVVLRDAGVVSDGLAITDDSEGEVQEREVTMTMMKKKTFVDVDTLSSVVDIKDFKSEIAETYGTKLGATVQKEAIEKTFFKADSAYVNENGWAALSPACAKTKSARIGGKLVGFLDPQAEAKLSVNALNGWHFGPSEQGAKFYHDASIGKFQGGEFVYVNDIPTVVGASITTQVANVVDKGDYSEVSLSGNNITAPKGTPILVGGAKACNAVGMPISSPFVMFLQEDAKNADVIKVQKIICEDIGSRNCYIEGNDLTGAQLTNMLESGKEYYVAQVRTEDTLSVDNVPLDELAGAENAKESVGGLELSVTKFGDSKTRVNRTRWDLALLYGIIDTRCVTLAYFPV